MVVDTRVVIEPVEVVVSSMLTGAAVDSLGTVSLDNTEEVDVLFYLRTGAALAELTVSVVSSTNHILSLSASHFQVRTYQYIPIISTIHKVYFYLT
jgi:hypothetical protein